MDPGQQKFFYHIGESDLVDEDGNEAMEYLEETEEFRLENLTNLEKYNEVQPIDLDAEMEDEDTLEMKIKAMTEEINSKTSEKGTTNTQTIKKQFFFTTSSTNS
jgi:hypothetical protein